MQTETSTVHEMLPAGESFLNFTERVGLSMEDKTAISEYTGALALHRNSILEQSGQDNTEEPQNNLITSLGYDE